MAGLTDTEIKRAKAAEKAYSMGDDDEASVSDVCAHQ